ncbi:PREDICTED: uncharacterized protein LOC105576117 [Cercocebus atys]|uniref:uncharacterized protein LOC105576117 n=1 Tax=Cercocebus atys TaxID=9531 RepID=UPI0005F3E0FA|nr:PREDICTED: uncharacterized protein LOC105576117 [Cercocebus atys]
MVPAATTRQVPSGPRPPVRSTGQPAGPASRTGQRRKVGKLRPEERNGLAVDIPRAQKQLRPSSPRNYQHPPKGHQPPCERTGQRPLELGCGRMWGAAWSFLPLPQRDMRDGAGLATWRESHSWS